MNIPHYATSYRLDRFTLQRLGEENDDFRTRMCDALDVANPSLGVPIRYPAVRDLSAWSPEDSLYLHGPVGVGKTSLLAALYYRALECAGSIASGWERVMFKEPTDAQIRGNRAFALRASKQQPREPVFITEQDVMEAYDVAKRGDKGPMNYIRQCGVLLLDDLGTEQRATGSAAAREFVAQRIEGLVSYRYAKGLTMVVTSNHTLADLAHLYGERTSSRLVEMCAVHQMGGVNWREG